LLAEHPDRLEIVHRLDDVHGFVDAALVVQEVGPRKGADFYICGPGPFMDVVEAGLASLDSPAEQISSLTDTRSNLAAVFQDGSPIGTLNGFSIGGDGLITGSFSNGLSRTIGQVALAKFSNSAGLVDIGNSMFQVGPNSGDPLVAAPLDFGTGRLIGGALELSNVDLSREFIDMILASTGYSASSRVITTTDELIDQLLLLGR